MKLSKLSSQTGTLFTHTGSLFVFYQTDTHLKSVPVCLKFVFYTGTLVKIVPVL
jgi:hypothetical protein